MYRLWDAGMEESFAVFLHHAFAKVGTNQWTGIYFIIYKVSFSKIPSNRFITFGLVMRSIHNLTGKESFPTIAFSVTCGHNKRFFHCSDGFTGSSNDQTMSSG
jgi:hypothetical protein